MGRSPAILPVWPLMAKVNFRSFHLVFRIQTEYRAYLARPLFRRMLDPVGTTEL